MTEAGKKIFVQVRMIDDLTNCVDAIEAVYNLIAKDDPKTGALLEPHLDMLRKCKTALADSYDAQEGGAE